ncbi:hypothetical protein L484_024511 [Morus notabilis]|uniref:RNA-binding protein 42 n=1 Tax=Morus notabilis TaxID=981085 RepID=W9S6R1_9ROSA|nr:hypothetical protein L484_024511 [Morus notabilis]
MASQSSSAALSFSSAAAASSSQYTYANGSSYFPMPFHLQQPSAVSQYPTAYAVGSSIPIPPPPVAAPVYPAPAPVAGVYSLPQYQQAQQLFQRDAQTITPEALESVKAALANSEIEHKAEAKKKAIPRKAAGLSWEDPTLAEWPENDYRIFCGDLGNEVNDDVLSKAFSRFPSFNMARLVSDPVSCHPNLHRYASVLPQFKVWLHQYTRGRLTTTVRPQYHFVIWYPVPSMGFASCSMGFANCSTDGVD